MSIHNIPDELKQYVQFVVWRYETTESGSLTKVPYNARTGHKASVTDPQAWSTFPQAVNAMNGEFQAGFVVTDRDPYCGIDLDDPYARKPDGTYKFDNPDEIAKRHALIIDTFDSYTEITPSGAGVRIWVKGRIPRGVRRDAVEVYSSERYFAMTGNVIRNVPIVERQEELNILFEEMSRFRHNVEYTGSEFQEHSDEEIFERASRAANGDLFLRLWRGDWSGYKSNTDGTGSSEADFALIDIIAFYTDNRMQIMRMFLASELGKRDKYAKANFARRTTLIGYMITKSFDLKLPPVDISGIMARVEAARGGGATDNATSAGDDAPAYTSAAVERPNGGGNDGLTGPRVPAASFSVDLDYWLKHEPPGILSMMRQYIYASSPRPVYEISLVASLALMAGMCGRQFNVSAQGLNNYFMLISDTGKGKEAIQSGISRIVTALVNSNEQRELKFQSAANIIGPSEIASGQALLKALPTRDIPCFVTMTGEFGIRLQQLTHPSASSAERTLLRVMLDLWGKSGAGQIIYPTIYSDKANNTDPVYSPAFSMIGEGTKETFYPALGEDNVATGLVPRFICVEYDGPRVPSNPNRIDEVPQQLIAAVDDLYMHILTLAAAKTVQSIGTTPDASERLDQLDKFCDRQINEDNTTDAIKQLWNRVHLKTYKIAGMLAVSHNFKEPIITTDMVEWAASLIMTDTNRMLSNYKQGKMGFDQDEDWPQIMTVKRVIRDYLNKPFSAFSSYKVPEQMHKEMVIPYRLIAQRTSATAAFRKSKIGPTNALKTTMQRMTEFGIVSKMPVNQLQKNYQYSGEAFVVLDSRWIFEDNDEHPSSGE